IMLMRTAKVFKRHVFAVFAVILICVSVAYWYVYGRERDLFEGTEVESVGKELGKYLNASNPPDGESKRISDLYASRAAMRESAVDGNLKLSSDGTLEGDYVSGQANWITNRVYVHVRIWEKR